MYEVSVKARWWHALIRRLAATRFGVWLLAGRLPRLDKPVLRLTGNRLSLTSILAGLPVVVLTTVGARSGLPRQTPLVGLPAGANLVLIATNFGNPRHPAWYYNLRANPQVEVSWQGQSARYRARQAQGNERQAYWQQAVRMYPGYKLYEQTAGERVIPVIVLEPLA